MKKSLLSLAVIGALGVAGAANAAVSVNPDGLGQTLLFPYYSVNGNNSTLINIVNTDETNGKLVKVRFRGAVNSDDVFDFTLALSPGDVWTGAVSKDAATGLAKMVTGDASCTLPNNINQNFVTARLSGTDEVKAANTAEGYIEVITMGDIQSTDAIFDAIDKADGESDCAALATAANLPDADPSSLATQIDTASDPALFGNATIINVEDTKTFSYNATALAFDNPQTAYWPQTSAPVTLSGNQESNIITADGVFEFADETGSNSAVQAGSYDFPDLSTPVDTDYATAADQRDAITAVLAISSTANEYITDASIAAHTEVVMSMPTRRYHVAGRIATDIAAPFDGMGTDNCVTLDGSMTIYNREELSPTTDSIVISPSTPAPSPDICGEVAIWTINQGSTTQSAVMGAGLTVADVSVPYADGWYAIPTVNADAAGAGLLPIISFTAVDARNNAGNAGYGSNFGAAWENRVTR